MALNKPKNVISTIQSLVNFIAVFSLISHILYPTGVIYAETVTKDETVGQNEITTDDSASDDSVDDGADEADVKPDKVVKAVITAYTSTADQTDASPFYGARGTHVYDGMIAVNGLPFGTKIKIRSLYGDKVFTVDDRMNKRYSCTTNHCRMDIWLDATKSEARKFGVKRVEAEIYYPDNTIASAK